MNNFKKLRLARGYSQKELAEILFVNQTAVSQWERGATTPSPTILLKMCEMYGTTVDYLLGRTDDPTDYENHDLVAGVSPRLLEHTGGDVKKALAIQKAIDADAMADPERIQRMATSSDVTAIGIALREARKLKGKKVEDIAEQMDVSVPTVTRWENGAIDIPSSVLFKYIALLGMTPAEFFAGKQDTGVTTRAAHLADGADDLPPEAEKELAQLMDYLRHKYSKKQ